MPCGVLCVTETVLLVIWCVALPLYVVVVAALIKYRKTTFTSSFFRVCISLGIADIISMVNMYALVKAPHWGWLSSFFMSYPYKMATYSLAWTWQSAYAQLNGIFILNLNRFTAIVFPEKQPTWWSDRNTNLFIFGQWFLSFVFAAPRPWTTIGFTYQADNKSLTYVFKEPELVTYQFKFLTFLHYSLCLSVLCMFVVMMCKVYRHNRQVGQLALHAPNESAHGAELRLALVASVIAITLFLYGIYDIVMIFEMDMLKVFLLWTVVNDLFAECNPFVLMCMCADVRAQVFVMLGFRKPNVQVVHVKSKSRTNPAQQQEHAL